MSPELFGKYEAILLETTLESMADIILCPRCDVLPPINLAIKNLRFLLNIWSFLKLPCCFSEWVGGGYCKLLIFYYKKDLPPRPHSVSASWSQFGHSSIHSKFLTHCLMDRKESALLRRARSSLPDWWKGARSLERGRAQVCLIDVKGCTHLRGARSLERGAHKFAWLMEMSAPLLVRARSKKVALFTIGNLLIQHTVSRWCSSGCVHEGCCGVDHWLQTKDWAFPGFLL